MSSFRWKWFPPAQPELFLRHHLVATHLSGESWVGTMKGWIQREQEITALSKLSGFSPDNSWCCSGVCTASTCQFALPTSGLQGDGVGHQSDHWQSVMDSVIPAWITLEDVPWSSLVTTQIWCAGLRADLVKRKRSVTICRTGSYSTVPGLLLLSTTCPWCTTAGETERSWFLPDWTGWFPGSSGLLQRSLLLVVYFKFAPLWTLQIPPVVTDVFPISVLAAL